MHRRLQPLYTEKRTVSSSGFLPKTSPMQHSFTQYNAFRSITWLTRMYLRTWQQSMTPVMQPFQCDPQPEIQETNRTNTQEQPLVAEHRGGNNSRMNDRSRNCRTHEIPCMAGCSHFTQKNGRFRAPASSPKQSPCNIHAASTVSQYHVANLHAACIYAHGDNHAAITRAYCYSMRCQVSHHSLTPPFIECILM